jgi:hypothetical protein
MVINLKILSYKSPQRHAVRRIIVAAQNSLRKEYPDLEVNVTEIKDLFEIEEITPVVILPSLMVNEKLVCVGRFPHKDEMVGWLREALQQPV